MGQEEVLLILEKYKKPMSRGEIAKALEADMHLVSHAIQRLIKGDFIKIIEIDRYQAMERYRCKRRMRLYYV